MRLLGVCITYGVTNTPHTLYIPPTNACGSKYNQMHSETRPDNVLELVLVLVLELEQFER